MTKALLDRSAAFVRLGEVAVDVITFDWRASYDGMRRELEQSGALVPGMRILNFWEEMSMVPDSTLRDIFSGEGGKAADEANAGSRHEGERAGGDQRASDATPLTRRVERSGGEVIRHFYRPDGSLLLTQRDAADSGSAKQAVHLFLREGTSVGSFDSMIPAYFLWLDLWREREPAYLVIDSKFSANWLVDYERRDTLVTHLVHGSHLADGESSSYGRWRTSRKEALIRSRDFDAVCVLTHRQREDLANRVGDLPNLHVVPNGFEDAVDRAHGVSRDARTGVMIGSLSSRKRVGHALRAIADFQSRAAEPVPLRIFGKGPEEERLRELASSLGISDEVEFLGFTDDADREFSRASFSLLTSSSEGLPFALLESMSAGCIPIAYDIPYGPADMIQDRVNGFLIPAGDVKGVAKAIHEFLSLSTDAQEEMRSVARASVERFRYPAVVAEWADIFTKARGWKSDLASVGPIKIRSAAIRYESRGEIIMSCEVDSSDALKSLVDSGAVYFALYERGRDLYFRRRVDDCWSRGEKLVLEKDISDGMRPSRSGTLDAFLEVGSGSKIRRQRVPFAKMNFGGAPYGTIHGNLSFHAMS